jgi:hypothetical protein
MPYQLVVFFQYLLPDHEISVFLSQLVLILQKHNMSFLKPGIDCMRLPREAIFFVLPRKVDTILPRALQNEHCRAPTWRVSSQIGAVLCPAAKGFQLRRSCGIPMFLSQRRSTAARGRRASMLDTKTGY